MTEEVRSVRPPTIHDVAREAGVSSQTVTRYVRGFEGIRPVTRQRVQAAIDGLGWKPNPLARALRLGTPTRIVLFVHEIEEVGPSNIIAAATRAAADAGFVLDVVPLDVNDLSVSAAAIRDVDLSHVAGAMAFAPTHVLADLFDRVELPVPLLREVNGDGIEGEHAQGLVDPGMLIVVDHLRDMGHRDVFVINGPEGWYSSAKRRRAVEERCAAHGMRIVGAETGDWSVGSGYEAAAAIPAAATAVIAANDEMALGALAAVWEHGRSVPGELSVTGFDDIRIAPYARPGLTTIHVDFRASGQLAIQRLLQMIAPEVAERRPKVIPVPPKLVVRGSTARVVTGGSD